MRSIFVAFTLFIGLSIILVACSGAGTPTPIPAASGAQISLTTNPNPAKSGSVELMVQVADAGGQPITDAEVFVFADHTTMGGMSMQGRATAQGGGRYATTADFSMAGTWKVSVQVRKSPLNITQEFELDLK